MIVLCPDCGQPLRVPDHLQNPLLRCRSCQTTFRPLDQREPEQYEEAASFDEDPEPEMAVEVPARREPSSTNRNRKKAGGGLGVIGLILFILIAKAPRLLKNLFDDRPKQQPAPVRVNDEDIEELNRMLNDQEKLPKRDVGEMGEFNNINAPRP